MYQSTKRKNSEKAAVKEILRQFFCIGKAAVQESRIQQRISKRAKGVTIWNFW